MLCFFKQLAECDHSCKPQTQKQLRRKWNTQCSRTRRDCVFIWISSTVFKRKSSSSSEKFAFLTRIVLVTSSIHTDPADRGIPFHVCIVTDNTNGFCWNNSCLRCMDLTYENMRRYCTVYFKSMKFIVLMLLATEHHFITSWKMFTPREL